VASSTAHRLAVDIESRACSCISLPAATDATGLPSGVTP
jgi:hypothetical protein